jgi:hypothetical protein
MIRKVLLGLGAICLAATIHNVSAQISFVGNGYVILDVNNAGNTYYDVNNQSNDNVTPSFDLDNSTPTAFTLTITIQQGQSILLGGQLETNHTSGSSAFLGYAVTNLAENNGNFVEMNLPFLDNNGNNGNDRWLQLASTSGVDIGSSLAPGNYLLAVYEHGHNTNDLFNNEAGQANNNWEAQIVVVPEPSVTSLLAGSSVLGAFFYLRRRRKA